MVGAEEAVEEVLVVPLLAVEVEADIPAAVAVEDLALEDLALEDLAQVDQDLAVFAQAQVSTAQVVCIIDLAAVAAPHSL